MVTQVRHPISLEEFETFIQQKADQNIDYEYIAGEIVPVVSNNYSSVVAMLIGGMISVHVYHNQLGYVTGADGGYVIGDERYISDVGFISKSRQNEPSEESYNPNPPNLAIEMVSPTDSAKQIRLKVVNYLTHNVTVWVIDPDEKQIEVYEPNMSPRLLSESDMLSGGEILQDFTVKVGDLFPKRRVDSQ